VVLPKKTMVLQLLLLRDTKKYFGIPQYSLVSLSTTTVFFSIGKKNPIFHIYVLILSSKVSERIVAIHKRVRFDILTRFPLRIWYYRSKPRFCFTIVMPRFPCGIGIGNNTLVLPQYPVVNPWYYHAVPTIFLQ